MAGCLDCYSRAGVGHSVFLGIPGEGIYIWSYSFGFPIPASVGAVGLEVGTYIPAVWAMGIPCFAFVRLFMDDYMGSRGSNWVAVEIVLSKDLGPS